MTYRLISKDHDYYDAMFHAYGFDPKKVWKREQGVSCFSPKSNEYEQFNGKIRDALNVEYYRTWCAYGLWVGVAGKLFKAYPKIKNLNDGKQHYYYSTFNDNVINLSDHFEEYNWRNMKGKPPKKEVVEVDLPFILAKSPVIVLEFNRELTITSNPILNDYNFSCVMNPFDVFMAVEQYLESVLSSYEEPLQTSDKDRIVSAGFDVKQSFRHRK